MQLTQSQQKAVNELLESFNPNEKTQVYFSAPTGSGKTFMISNFINDLAKNYCNEKLIFIIATLSSSELPKQMENNLNEYKMFLDYSSNLKIERIISPSVKNLKNKDQDVYMIAEKNKVMILGNASFKKNCILVERGKLEGFLQQIKNENYKLIYIRDEAHHGGKVEKNKDDSGFETKMQKIAHYIIKMTATPKEYNIKQIRIDEDDLKKDNIYLLKQCPVFNDLKDYEKEEYTNEEILDIACKKFKSIKKEYMDSEKEPSLIGINPAMLIQVKDEPKDPHLKKEFKNNIDSIIKILENNGLTWVKYFSNEKVAENATNIRTKVNLKDISKNSSEVDAIIFKIGPATGWNIPRACMLVQLRNVSSDSLNVQTVGRIKRNPAPVEKSFENIDSIKFNYYLYSNFKDEKRLWDYYILRDDLTKKRNETIQFYSGIIDEDLIKEISNSKEYISKVQNFLNNDFGYVDLLLGNKNYKKVYIEKGFIENKIQELYNGNNNFKIIESIIQNKIELRIEIMKLKNSLKRFLNKKINELIQSKFDEFNKDGFGGSKTKIDNDILWFIFLKKYSYKIKEFFQDYKKLKKASEFKLITKELPFDDYQYVSNSNNCLKFKQPPSFDEYLLKYAYLNTNKKNEGIHHLDSKNEVQVLGNFKNLFFNSQLNLRDKINIWTKNPTFKGISFNYFDENMNTVKTSYPDLLIKYKNHQILLEIKGLKDIDKDKTLKMLRNYKQYTSDDIIKKMDKNNDSLTIGVVHVSNNRQTLIAYSTLKHVNDHYSKTDNPDKAKNFDFLEFFDILDLYSEND